jgi:hypothetical protein
MHQLQDEQVRTTANDHVHLYGIATWFADVFEKQRFV